MRPSPSLCSKASKFQLISKHANKDYYKGRRQSQPTGVGYRTGPPGKHVGPEKSQFLIDDERVRVFVGPAFKADGSAEFAFDKLKPFAHIASDPTLGYPFGLPGVPSRRVEWFEQLSREVPGWTDRVRDEQLAVERSLAVSGGSETSLSS